ncbi:arsenate reductase/protein-tyrosine-phosphatase family protein [Microbacterium aurugineum]
MSGRGEENPPTAMSRRSWRRQQSAAAPLPFGAAPFLGGSLGGEGDQEGPLTILTVCTGNICRSPLAEVLLRARLEPLGVRVHSAGTHALVDHAMTEPAQALAVEAGARAEDAAAHRARYLREPLLRDADLVLTMAREHSAHAVRMMPSRVRRTFTARELARWSRIVDPEHARAAAESAGETPRARFAAVLGLLSAERGPLTAGTEDDDVIDPYRRSAETYARSSAQLLPGIDEVERLVRIAIG